MNAWMRWLAVSATKTSLDDETASPVGILKWALSTPEMPGSPMVAR